MKDIPIADVRNFVLVGHTGSGKTALVDALLYKLGVNDRLGNPGDGTSAVFFVGHLCAGDADFTGAFAMRTLDLEGALTVLRHPLRRASELSFTVRLIVRTLLRGDLALQAGASFAVVSGFARLALSFRHDKNLNL